MLPWQIHYPIARPYQLVVYGASGFTGTLVAEYLSSLYPPGSDTLRWALGGRDEVKLHDTRQDIGATDAGILVADAHDRRALDAMCAQADVVCTTVGPYAKYGSELVAACVAKGSDYCDLSGEVPWMRRMIERHHAEAEENGTRIVHSCGFDSIPSDVGVLHLQEHALSDYGDYCTRIDMMVAGAKGGFSGGTYASLFNVLREGRESTQVAEVLADPYALNYPAEPGTCSAPDRLHASYDPAWGTYLAPFVMAAINTRIVRRSNALAGFRYGQGFCYSEAVATGGGVVAGFAAKAMALGTRSLQRSALVAQLAERITPEPGEGPAAAAREAGYFKLKFRGVLPDGQVVHTQLKGQRDPGYGCTSRMLTQAALALVDTRGQGRAGGILTPATAIGDELLARLPEAGVTLSIQ